MNKTELIEELGERTGSSKEETRRYVKALGSAVTAAPKGGDYIRIPGFDKFYVQQREACEGTYSQTKVRLPVPASKVPKFETGNGLKRAV